MEAAQGSGQATQRFSKTAKTAAGIVVFAGCLLALFLAGRSKGYESQALLSYAPAASSSTEGVIPATVAANRALDDTHLLVIINTYDLYPQLRQSSPDQAVLAHMRSLIRVDEPNPVSLRISFLDQDERKSKPVTNDLAEVLAAYWVAGVTAPAPVPAVAVVNSISNPLPAQPVSGTDLRVQHRLARVAAQLSSLRREEAALIRGSSAAAQGQPEREGARATTSALGYAVPQAQTVEPNAVDRAALEGRLAFEQSHLVALLARYTEAYPEVVATRGTISELKADLAVLPVPRSGSRSVVNESPHEVQPVGQSAVPKVDKGPDKKADKATDEAILREQLERNQRAITALESERAALTARLASASAEPTATASAASTQEKAEPAVPTTILTGSAAPTSPPDVASPQTVQASAVVEPFKIEQRALQSVLVRMYPPMTFAWIALGATLLLLLILLPGLFRPGFLRPAAMASESTDYGRFLEDGMDGVEMYRPESAEETIGTPEQQLSAYAPTAYHAAAFASDKGRDSYSPEEYTGQAIADPQLPSQAMSSEPAQQEEHGESHGDRNREGDRSRNLDSRIARAVAKHYGS